MKHTKRWLALILAIALVVANASYQLGTSLYANEDQSAIETQSEESQTQESVNTEEPKSTGSVQVEEVQNNQNTSEQTDEGTAEAENAQNNADQNNESVAAPQEANDTQDVAVQSVPTLTVNADGSVSGSGYDSITLNINTDGIKNQNNTAFNIKFDTGNAENNKKISASNLNPSEGVAKNLKKNNGGTFIVDGFSKNAFTITVSKVDSCKNSVKAEAAVDTANGKVTLTISDYYESAYNDKTFETPTATSLGSVNDFAVFANNYKNHVDMEGNIAVRNMLLANTNGGNSDAVQAKDFNLNYVENFVMDSMKSEFFRKADPLIVGDDYEINTQDSNFNLKLKNGAVVNLGPSNKVKDVVNIKNSSYKINFDEAMEGLKQYAANMYGKSDTEGVKFQVIEAGKGKDVKRTDRVQQIVCKKDVNNIIHVKASELKNWADEVELTNLGDKGSVTFNIEYDVADQFTKPHFKINGQGTSGYDAKGGRILLNFGTKAGEITFGELYSGTILAPNATVDIYTTHNGSVYADTVENINGEIHKNPWKPGKDEEQTSVNVYLRGTKTFDGASAESGLFKFLLQQTDESGNVIADGYHQEVTNGDAGQIAFDQITYTTPGTYYYNISEVAGDDANINYDQSVYQVVVTVDESMLATVTYKLNGQVVNADTGAAFSNTSIQTLKVQVTFAGNKTVNDLEARDAFSFKLVEKDENGKDIKTIDANITNKTGEGENGAIQFPTMEYNKVGTHYYEISENVQSGNSVTYDRTVYTAVVKVEKSSDGLVATTKYYKNYNYSDKSKNQELKGTMDFANTMQTSVRLHGTKMLDQSKAEKDAFTFEVTQVDADGTAVADGYLKEVKNGADGAIETENLTFDAPGTYYYKIREKAGDQTNIQYDDSFYTAVVVVEKDGLNLSAQNVKYYKNINGSQITEQTSPADSMIFRNKTKFTDIQFDGKKVLIGKDQTTGEALKLQKGQFTFDIVEANEDGTVKAGASCQNVQNEADGTIAFPTYSYAATGDYYYRISEQQSDALKTAGMNFDQSIYLVHVNVSDNGNNFEAKVQSVTKYADQKAMDVKNGTTVTEITNNDVATFTNRVRYGSVKFAGNKTLNGNPATDTFRYTVVEKSASGTQMSDGYKSGVITNDVSGNIMFSDISYTKAGTYYYEIKEIDDSADTTGIKYDKTIYTAVVTVTNDDSEEGTGLSSTVKYYKDYNYHNKAGMEADQITFANTMSTSVQLEGTKTLDGKNVTTAGDYSFDIVETDKAGNPVDGAIVQTVSNDNTGKFVSPKYNYSEEGTYYYKITENQNNKKDGIKYDNSSYLATITVTKTKNQNGKVSLGAEVTDIQKTDENNTTEKVDVITFNNQTITYADANIQLTAAKNLAGSPSEKIFDFKMEECDENGNVADGAQTIMASNDENGYIIFDEITYTEAGTHYYKISEVIPENPETNIVYDHMAYIVKVDVTKDDATSALAANVSSYKQIATDENGQTIMTDAASVVFNNGMHASTLFTGKKYVDGELASTAGEFSFTLTRTDADYENALTGEDGYNETVFNDAAGNITFTEIQYNVPGEYYYTISEDVPASPQPNMYYDEAVYRAKVTVSADGQVTVEKSVVPYEGYEDGSEPVEEDEEFLMFNNYSFMTMSMNYGLATIQGTKTLTGGNLEAGEFRFGLYDENGTLIDTTTNDASGKIAFRTIPYYVPGIYQYTVKEIVENDSQSSDIEYDPSTYTATVTVDENMDTSITYEKDGVDVDNLLFENKLSVTAAVIDPSVTKILNNAKLQPGEFTFQLFDSNDQLIDTKKNTDSGSVLFDSIIFNKAGDYSYTIKELIPEDPGQITYDGREIKVNVKVTKNADTGNLEAAVTYLEDNAPTENPTFVNTYHPISIRVQKTSKDGSKDPLQGATYALYKVLGNEGRDILIGTQLSDANGYMTFDNIEPGTYYFKEVSAPAGHTVDEYATKKFTVSADGKINALGKIDSQAKVSSLDTFQSEESGISLLNINDNPEIEEQLLAEAPGVSDEVTKLNVSKLDYTSHEFVAGAKMQILEKSSGRIVAEWTTGNSAESFERKLNVDTPYILREVSAPAGYDLAKDTEFIIDAYGILSITSGTDAEKTSDTSLSIYDKKLGVTNVTTNTKENHNQKFVDIVKTVKTGDTAKIGLLAIIVIAAAIVVIITLRRRKNS